MYPSYSHGPKLSSTHVPRTVERGHDSALARFLLYRALHNRTLTGHYLFWCLKAALNGSSSDERYLALIQASVLSSPIICLIYDDYTDAGDGGDSSIFFLLWSRPTCSLVESTETSCTPSSRSYLTLGSSICRLELIKSRRGTYFLLSLYSLISRIEWEPLLLFLLEHRTKVLQEGLMAYSQFASFPAQFHLPLDPRIVATGFVVEKCKVMDSNTVRCRLTRREEDEC